MRGTLDAEVVIILCPRLCNVGIVVIVAILLFVVHRGIGGSGCLWEVSVALFYDVGAVDGYYRVFPSCRLQYRSP